MQGLRKLWRRFFDRTNASAAEGVAQAEARLPTRLIVGLGNPGPEYEDTRHNVGFRVVELLADRFGGEWSRLPSLDALGCFVEIDSELSLLLKPQTFMNRSGEVVRAAFELWPELLLGSDLLVVYDDMDLPTGRIRLRPKGGSGGHRGIGNILDELESKDIQRLRVGVGHPGSISQVVGWVLDRFSEEEDASLLPALLARSADSVEAVLREGMTSAMGQFNADQN